MEKLIKWIAFFNDDSNMEFDCVNDYDTAYEYAEYRAKLRNTTVDFIL